MLKDTFIVEDYLLICNEKMRAGVNSCREEAEITLHFSEKCYN